MKLLKLLKSDFQRAVFSYRFLICTLLVAILVTAGSCIMLLDVAGANQDIISLIIWGLRGNGIEMLNLCIFPLVPFSLSFAMEWKEHSYLFYISRVGTERYILSKMIISAISGFLVLFIGVSLSVSWLKLLIPSFDLTAVPNGDFFYTVFFERGQVVLGYFVFILNYSLIACLTTTCAVWFSTYVPNPLVVLAAPLLINFTLIRISDIYKIEGVFDKYIFFNPLFWINTDYPTTSPIKQLGYRIGNVLLLSLIMGFFAVRKAKRRVLNG